MSQVVSTPNQENNVGRTVAKSNILGGSNSERKPKDYHKQKRINTTYRKTETELNQEIAEFFQTNFQLKLNKIEIHHVSPQLATCLQATKFTEASGITIAILHIDNHPKYFGFSLCDLKDTFSRLEGRVYAKRRMLHKLKDSLPRPILSPQTKKEISVTTQVPNFGLFVYPIPEAFNTIENQAKVTPLKIANWVIKNFVKPKIEKPQADPNPLIFKNEDTLLKMAKKHIAEVADLDPASIKLYTQYIRYYETSHFKGALATPEFFAELDDKTKQLNSFGGYTVYGITAKHRVTGAESIFVTISRCSNKEAFTRSLGRKQCLINFTKNQFNPYSLSQPLESVSAGLLVSFQELTKLTVNVDLTVKSV